VRRALTVLSVAAALVLPAARARGAAPPAPAPCDTPEHHQLDFFLGDWDTFDVDAPATLAARNQVTPMVGGCALREVYEGENGLRGESFSTYDAGRGVWHQSWVTNRGQLLLLDGKREGARMEFTAHEATAAGEVLWRAAWWQEGAAVRERAERSTDGGKTWKVAFDIVFRKHAA
jgi:hypothetical protein